MSRAGECEEPTACEQDDIRVGEREAMVIAFIIKAPFHYPNYEMNESYSILFMLSSTSRIEYASLR
jgi:hypothetical protein